MRALNCRLKFRDKAAFRERVRVPDNFFRLECAFRVKFFKAVERLFQSGYGLLGKKYAAAAGMTLLPETEELVLYGKTCLISHGDEMCTDDTSYQHFRRVMRNQAVQKILLSLPQKWRRKIAADMRAASRRRKREIGMSSISDVTQKGVCQALSRHPQAEILIHGHTHRPAVHRHTCGSRTVTRYVLPDWHDGRGGFLSVSEKGCEILPLVLHEAV